MKNIAHVININGNSSVFDWLQLTELSLRQLLKVLLFYRSEKSFSRCHFPISMLVLDGCYWLYYIYIYLCVCVCYVCVCVCVCLWERESVLDKICSYERLCVYACTFVLCVCWVCKRVSEKERHFVWVWMYVCWNECVRYFVIVYVYGVR